MDNQVYEAISRSPNAKRLNAILADRGYWLQRSGRLWQIMADWGQAEGWPMPFDDAKARIARLVGDD